MGCCCRCCCCYNNSGNSNGNSGDYIILYPNNGSKEKPAKIGLLERIVMENPFKGFEVICKTEVLYEGKWGEIGWWGCGTGSAGATAFQLLPEDNIIIITSGNNTLLGNSSHQPNPFNMPFSNSTSGHVSSLPCRVKVFKLAKIED